MPRQWLCDSIGFAFVCLGVVASGSGLTSFDSSGAGSGFGSSIDCETPAGTGSLVFSLSAARIVGYPPVSDSAADAVGVVVCVTGSHRRVLLSEGYV